MRGVAPSEARTLRKYEGAALTVPGKTGIEAAASPAMADAEPGAGTSRSRAEARHLATAPAGTRGRSDWIGS